MIRPGSDRIVRAAFALLALVWWCPIRPPDDRLTPTLLSRRLMRVAASTLIMFLLRTALM
ncbi:unnamed protein product [[Actinomadura] parvosata subsp. kistnae]|uniref:Uncharacterized protein n=1 Tax=[Actinomadura] parvosata subsp. kistnae TaxID=1909395 RepID=A0A1U9ZYJ5_9ACTN|nr:hypothetical protein [Nonomuraea sp. ATCC 55076]AQZ63014.1 hypothetical protein BKM31_17490 [Nonomuraea sp. ATCC 55076]SPL99963.1 unnamed protein product [Actinomadura parvosata subsp. kistnae]